MKIDKIIVKGKKEIPAPSAEPADDLILVESISVGSDVRAGGEKHPIELQDNKLVEMVFEDGTRWFSNADTLEDLYPEVAAPTRSADGAFEIPSALQSSDGERSIVGDIALKVVNVFIKKPVSQGVAFVAAKFEKNVLDNQSGLYRVDSGFNLKEFKPERTDKPYLLFLHGTASSTNGSFGKMLNTELWNYITKTYENNIIGFQHETLTKSPLQNVLELVKLLPQNISLHIISHSRGGLVGDILSRFCTNNENVLGFDANETRLLKDHGGDTGYIKDLKEEFKNKKIFVNKFIRVACPAAGTTLASKRLDTYFNIISNLIGVGTGAIGNPVYAGFRNLIAAVIDTKNDVDTLPGIEAMSPRSPFIKVLNLPSSSSEIDNPLTIISGNSIINFSLKGLLAIVSKLFYFTDNDMVVDTGSMYKGSKRTKPAQYFFDESADVDHLHYFKNKTTNDAILKALSSENENSITGFKSVESDKLRSAGRSGVDPGEIFKNKVTGTKPIVVLLPGIMGSNLTRNDELIWINYEKFLAGKLTDLDISANGIDAPSLIKTPYKDLVDFLSASYDVVTFPYDWRLSLDVAAGSFNQKIEKLLEYKQPIKIIGHSMGGVVVRDFILKYKKTWDKLNQSKGFRLIFLGTPLGGSFRIPAMLFGMDPMVDKLVQIDPINNQNKLLKMFSQWPGLLSQLPHSSDKENDFSQTATWIKMSKSFNDWTPPKSKDLEEFKVNRDNANRNFNNIDFNGPEFKNIIYIAGQDKSTPCGYRIDKRNKSVELVFLSTGEGDGFAAWDTGIPKKMDSVYFVDVTHGELANEKGMFKGIEEILENGSTNLFNKKKPIVRGDQKFFRTPEASDFDLSPLGVENTILGIGTKKKSKYKATPIRVSVSNGDLCYSTYPVLAGHFYNDGILYAEKSINDYLKNELAERHRLGIYPGPVGTSEIFIPLEHEYNFKGAIIVGMGIQDQFTAFQLTLTVEQGVSKYLLNLNSKNLSKPGSQQASPNLKNFSKAEPSGSIGISSLIIGSGYAGLSVENSVRAIVQGVQNANDKLLKMRDGSAKTIQHIEFVELYKNTALRCIYTLSKMEKEENKSLAVVLDNKKIKTLFGSKDRIPVETTEGWWGRVTIKNLYLTKAGNQNGINNLNNQESSTDEKVNRQCSGNIRWLQFNASTAGAREEQRELRSSVAIVDELIEDISIEKRWTPEVAKTIFELLIPNDFKEQFKRQGNINFILDKDTASYPWELLQDSTAEAKPLCINGGMIRQLATSDFRIKIKSVSNDNALVIGDPLLKGSPSQLPGAKEEGEQISALLKEKKYDTVSIINGTAPKIIEALFSQDYKIVHLAGHGFFDKDCPEYSGMVIGNKTYLTTMEISQMPTVPDLVFVNCCYLGKTDGAAEELFRSRYKLAANIGTQLIENGVKAVVAAGWEVNDKAALDFSRQFYEKMFDGANFGEAIHFARKYIYENYQESNTWGAYQCYGDPFYRLKSGTNGGEVKKLEFKIEQEAEVELDNLLNDLDAYNETNEKYLMILNDITKAVDDAGLRNALITEKEAIIYSNLGEYDTALNKFGDLMEMEDSLFSVSTIEKYCNIRVKKFVRDFSKSKENGKNFVQKVKKVIKELQYLININRTAKRLVIMGSAYKRKSILCGKSTAEKIQAYKDAAASYREAFLMKNKNYEVYALINFLEMNGLLVLSGNSDWRLNISFENKNYVLKSANDAIKLLNKVKDSQKLSESTMQFWEMLTEANVKLCSMIINQSTSGNQNESEEVFNSYRKVWNQAGSKGRKISEIENLEFWIDALSNIKKKNAKINKLTKMIKQLKEELEKLI